MTLLLWCCNRLPTTKPLFLYCKQMAQKLPQCRLEKTKKYFVTCKKSENLMKNYHITTSARKTYWTSTKKRFDWNKYDNIPKEFSLIYRNSSEKYTKLIINFVPLTAMIIGMVVYRITSSEKQIKWRETKRGSNDLDILTIVVVGAVYITMLLCVTQIYRLTMNRLYKHSQAELYVAVFPRFFLWTKNVAFRKKDIIRKNRPEGLYRYISGDIRIKNKPLIFSADDFAQPCYYNEMLGYDLDAYVPSFKDDDIVIKEKKHGK